MSIDKTRFIYLNKFTVSGYHMFILKFCFCFVFVFVFVFFPFFLSFIEGWGDCFDFRFSFFSFFFRVVKSQYTQLILFIVSVRSQWLFMGSVICIPNKKSSGFALHWISSYEKGIALLSIVLSVSLGILTLKVNKDVCSCYSYIYYWPS